MYVKRDNLCISISMSNLYISIYISVGIICPGGRKGGCFGIPPECRECNQVPFLLSLSPTPPSFWCASIVFLSHYSLWFLLIFTRILVTIIQNYIFWYFVLLWFILIINQVLSCSPKESNIPITAYPGEENYYLFLWSCDCKDIR